MRYGIVEFLPQRNIPLAEVIVVVGTEQVVLSTGGSRLIKRLVGSVDVVTTEPFQPSIGDNGDGWVAFHRVSLPSKEFPFRHPAMLFVHINHGTDHIPLFVGIEKREQLVYIAIGVP